MTVYLDALFGRKIVVLRAAVRRVAWEEQGRGARWGSSPTSDGQTVAALGERRPSPRDPSSHAEAIDITARAPTVGMRLDYELNRSSAKVRFAGRSCGQCSDAHEARKRVLPV